MMKIIKLKQEFNEIIEDFNLFLYNYSSLTLNELKKVNLALHTIAEVFKDVEITIPYN